MQQLVVAEVLLLCLKNGQLLGLLFIVDDTLGNVVTYQVVFSPCQYLVDTCHLVLEEFDDIAGFTETYLLVLMSEYLVKDVQCVVGDTCIIS